MSIDVSIKTASSRFMLTKWLFWLTMNTLSLSIAFAPLFFGLFFATLSGDEAWGLELVLIGGISGAFAGLAGGILVGVAQWLVILRDFRRSFHWIWRTAIGSSIGYAGSLAAMNLSLVLSNGFDLSDSFDVTVQIAVIIGANIILGGAIGVMQRPLFRQISQGSERWIWINCLAWSLGMSTAVWSVQIESAVSFQQRITLFGGIGGALVGAITGVVLVWLLKHPLQNKGP